MCKVHCYATFLIILFSIIACYQLLTTEGFILYGDFTLPTSLQRFFDMHYPLWNQYGSVNSFEFVPRLSFRALPVVVATFFKTPADLFYKIMVLSTMILSGVSMYFSMIYLTPSNRTKRTCIIALAVSVIYMFNFKAINTIIWPTLQFTYAIAPIAMVSFIKFTSNPRLRYALLVALLMTMIAGSPHYLVFIALLM